jgi:hypothetical protein
VVGVKVEWLGFGGATLTLLWLDELARRQGALNAPMSDHRWKCPVRAARSATQRDGDLELQRLLVGPESFTRGAQIGAAHAKTTGKFAGRDADAFEEADRVVHQAAFSVSR